ncbi:putative zinc-binding protein [Methanohalophilus portucalensis]|uniref:DGC domain protein n=1 Tax=Methanohalophilus portucalensis FDF-1 TaxID=523843 RepID=A0A1L9C476_9EURY|nr:putative zinc-binding protein [Methanohalophilus portucalensis]OJH49273.1 DGC domain protein [Methanohalophilus portucalensis FDF-1]SMH42042.1 DGC domain-containing protein [Methanohalophilus portucalensis FDF-1]
MTEELKVTEKPTCACEAAIIGLYVCSGIFDVGQVANKITVELTKPGKGKIMCTIGIGGNFQGL